MKFTPYQKFVVAMLAFLQFTIILDFMIISPLGAVIMPALTIGPREFGMVVSAYAFSAGLSGILAAGFADRYDRKKLLLFFYGGFLLGTLFCGLAPTFKLLLAARIVTGLFGGVIGAVVLAIATDLFAMEQRGRVMGFVQTAFAASQILGIPAGLYVSNAFDWHAPFIMIVGVGVLAGLAIIALMKPVNAHLQLKQDHSPFGHLVKTVSERRYMTAFAVTTLLATGGYMIMPFGSAFTVNNLGIHIESLPTIYLISGLCTMFIGPVIGKMSDQFGKFQTFMAGSALSILMVVYYTNMGVSPLWLVIAVNILMFIGVFSRMIPSQALMTAIPAPNMRGSFNAVSASLQQFSGGIASLIAGLVVVQTADGKLDHFDTLGYIIVGTTLVSLLLMYKIHKTVSEPKRS